LVFTQFQRLSSADRTKAETHLRVWFKRFVRIPVNTADHTYKLIAGDLTGVIRWSAARFKRKLWKRMEHVEKAVRLPEPIGIVEEEPPTKGLKYLPKGLAETLRVAGERVLGRLRGNRNRTGAHGAGSGSAGPDRTERDD
ncbi:unnamed protein product, partial [Sphagnum jensenii]